MNKGLWIVLAVVAVVALTGLIRRGTARTQYGTQPVGTNAGDPVRITPADLKKKLDAKEALLIVGVLPAPRFANYRLPGAISADELQQQLPKLSRDTEIVAY